MKRLAFVLGVLLLSCSEKQISDVPIVSFDLSIAKQMKMSEFVDSITLIPLETNDSSLVKGVQTLNVTETNIFIEERGNMIVFDKNGTFLYSTRHLQGAGPKNYYSALDFTSFPDGSMEVFDAVKLKLIKYDKELHYISEHKLPREILPVAWCWYVSEDYRLFVHKSELKFYSVKDSKIVNSLKTKEIPHFGFYTRNCFRVMNNEFFLSMRNQNSYYNLVFDNLKLDMRPIYKLDFGEGKNFNALDLPEGEAERFYIEYSRNNPRKVFVDEIYVDADKQMCFFIYDNKSYFAYQNNSLKINQVYCNIPMAKKQFLPANSYCDGVFYYACEPQALEYVIDECLMSSDELRKMETILEDDNPIIVCYKLK